jgi:hypothetical protein
MKELSKEKKKLKLTWIAINDGFENDSTYAKNHSDAVW